MNYKRRTNKKIKPPIFTEKDFVFRNYVCQLKHFKKYKYVLHDIETKNYKLTEKIDKNDSWFWYLMGY